MHFCHPALGPKSEISLTFYNNSVKREVANTKKTKHLELFSFKLSSVSNKAGLSIMIPLTEFCFSQCSLPSCLLTSVKKIASRLSCSLLYTGFFWLYFSTQTFNFLLNPCRISSQALYWCSSWTSYFIWLCQFFWATLLKIVPANLLSVEFSIICLINRAAEKLFSNISSSFLPQLFIHML